MCTPAIRDFGSRILTREVVEGRTVLEVGSLDVNGSLRPVALDRGASRYVGVDLQAGPGVDIVCRAERLIEQFGSNAFDLVISTELLEHAEPWRLVIHHLKTVVKPQGLLLITTRSIGFPYHGYPHDHWRFQLEDFRAIFSDWEIETLESDPRDPGVFLVARKPLSFTERDLSDLRLFSMITGRRALHVRAWQRLLFSLQLSCASTIHAMLPKSWWTFLKRVVFRRLD